MSVWLLTLARELRLLIGRARRERRRTVMSADRADAPAIGPVLAWGLCVPGCLDMQGRFDPVAYAALAGDPRVRCVAVSVDAAACTASSPLELMLFIERLRRLSDGKPVGIALDVCPDGRWFALVKAMQVTRAVPAFIVVADTGNLALVHETLVGVDLHERIHIGCGDPLEASLRLATEGVAVAWPTPAHADDWELAQVAAFSPLPPDSLGAEHAVTRIAQARDDVAVVVELPVDRGGVDRHVRVVGMEA